MMNSKALLYIHEQEADKAHTIHGNPCEKHQPTAQSDDSARLSCSGTTAAPGRPLRQGQRARTALETIWYPADLWREAEAT